MLVQIQFLSAADANHSIPAVICVGGLGVIFDATINSSLQCRDAANTAGWVLVMVHRSLSELSKQPLSHCTVSYLEYAMVRSAAQLMIGLRYMRKLFANFNLLSLDFFLRQPEHFADRAHLQIPARTKPISTKKQYVFRLCYELLEQTADASTQCLSLKKRLDR